VTPAGPPPYERVKAVLLELRALAATERAERLAGLATHEPALYREVASLLAADGEDGPVKTGGLAGAIPAITPGMAAAVPERVGAYRVVGVLGEGGMGLVLRAEQEAPIRREVALKLVRAGLDTARVVARFEAERQAIALMDHPGIARVLDAGADERGRPFFVMELVQGTPITRFCDDRGLALAARLDLFLLVCEAVQHAHQRGLIHRDLKPANILVTDRAGRAEPKVIDFGIAKAIAEPLGGPAPLTQEGQRLGTPEYMSPEQAGELGVPVDVRSDVYSLGVVLHELLTGARPRPLAPSAGGGTPRELERPSACVTGSAGTVALATGGAERLRRRLAGDLDTIVLMALRAEPDRRYGSVEALALDLRRHLDGHPVLARPDSTGYRLSRFVTRHRVGVTLAAAGVAALGAVAGISTIQSERVARERDRAVAAEQRASAAARRARLEARTANRVTDLVAGLFEVASPTESRGAELTAQEILRRGEEKVEGDLADDPEVQARLLRVLGEVHHGLGDLPRARTFLERALALQRTLRVEPDAALADTLSSLADLEHDEGRLGEALARTREVLEIRTRVFGPRSAEAGLSLGAVGLELGTQAQLEESEATLREAVDILREARGADDADVAYYLNVLGQTVYRRGDVSGSLPHFEQALAIQRRLLGPLHPDTAGTLNNLAGARLAQGDLPGAEALFREALATYGTLYGEGHAAVPRARGNLGRTLRMKGALAEAEALERSALEGFRRLLGPRHAYVAKALSNLAQTLLAEGRPAEAEPLVREAVAIQREAVGPDHPSTGTALLALARVEAALGERDLARARAREGHAVLLARLGAAHPDVLKARELLGELGVAAP